MPALLVQHAAWIRFYPHYRVRSIPFPASFNLKYCIHTYTYLYNPFRSSILFHFLLYVQTEWLSEYNTKLSSNSRKGAIENDAIKHVDGLIQSLTFLSSPTSASVTIADILIYSAMHKVVKEMKRKQMLAHPSLVRWFSYIQTRPSLCSLPSALPLITIGQEPARIYSATFAAPAEAPVAAATTAAAEVKSAPAKVEKNTQSNKNEEKKQPENKNQNKNKKAKKEKKPKKAKAPAKASNNITRFDIRVGKVTAVAPHPTQPEKMYAETIDVGSDMGGERPVVSGIASFIKQEDFLNQLVLVVCNLKAADVKGSPSEGRVLIATSADGKTKELVQPPAGAIVGEKISFPGIEGEPDATVSSKWVSKVLKTLKTDADCQAIAGADVFTTTAGPCKAATVASGTVA